MSDPYWKKCERRVARFFGTERTPLSGENSRHNTHSDTLHQELYVEVKSSSGPTGTNGWIWRMLEKLDWPEGLVRIGGMWTDKMYSVYLMHCDAQNWSTVPFETAEVCKPAWRLIGSVQLAASQENKEPLIALCCKRKHGFWLIGEAGALLKAMRIRSVMGTRES